ncbi:MAG: hypothetical protein JHC71_03395 [Blastococcus sp.]|nr:hypothetical protein [Blastococcus sp.]
MRPVLRVLAVLVVAGASLLSPVASSTPAQQAQAADTRLFNPGNIISDTVFFDGRAMDAPAIQEFLRSKSPSSCAYAATDGSPCLEDFRMTTTDRAADSLCAGYSRAANESAATIIAKVAVSCRVNPRVLLVLLQKEMGFVTSSNPTAKMYVRAAGYGCPDNGTGKCDPSYEGLQNQLYRSAWQYQKYAATPKNYSYRAGFNNTIQWDVPTSCGTSVVYIQNQATAGLYNYTPYRPNQAALNAGYGTGNDCSAYGNRNFWLYFTDWFGSTQSTGGAAIAARAAQPDAAAIGLPTSGVNCGLVDRGCFRAHERGAIYWSPDTGAHLMSGAIHSRWAQLGWEGSRLGYPTMSQSCYLPGGGCFQEFQDGAVYWSPATGAHPVLGAIRTTWNSTGWEAGPLGYPTAAEACGLAAKGCVQSFQNGHVYWSSASGAHLVMPGAIRDLWWAKGGENSSLGYPTGEVQCGLPDSGCRQTFLTGAVYTSASKPILFASGAVATKYAATGAHAGALGFPTSNTVCGLRDGGCFQEFERGAVYSSPAGGARTVLNGVIRAAWAAQRWEQGPLGYPASDQKCGSTGCSQLFTGGAVYRTATGTHVVKGELYKAYAAANRERGPLGLPTGGAVCGLSRGGCFQQFSKGSVYWTAGTGGQRVTGKILQAWGAQGWERGSLGYPTGAPVASSKGITQRFQGGTLVQAAGTGTVTRR